MLTASITRTTGIKILYFIRPPLLKEPLLRHSFGARCYASPQKVHGAFMPFHEIRRWGSSPNEIRPERHLLQATRQDSGRNAASDLADMVPALRLPSPAL